MLCSPISSKIHSVTASRKNTMARKAMIFETIPSTINKAAAAPEAAASKIDVSVLGKVSGRLSNVDSYEEELTSFPA